MHVGIEPSKGHGHPTSSHTFEENWPSFSSSHQLSMGSHLGTGFNEPLSHPCWDAEWLGPVEVTTAAVSWWVQWPCRVQKTACHSPPPAHNSFILPDSFSTMFPESCRERMDVDVPLRVRTQQSLILSTLTSHASLSAITTALQREASLTKVESRTSLWIQTEIFRKQFDNMSI